LGDWAEAFNWKLHSASAISVDSPNRNVKREALEILKLFTEAFIALRDNESKEQVSYFI
jgi:hypothetical protein